MREEIQIINNINSIFSTKPLCLVGILDFDKPGTSASHPGPTFEERGEDSCQLAVCCVFEKRMQILGHSIDTSLRNTHPKGSRNRRNVAESDVLIVNPTVTCTCCMSSGKLLNLSLPQFPYPEAGL